MYSTEQTSTSNSSQSRPPPGFNAEKAKIPLPQDQAQSQPAPGTKQDVKAPAQESTGKVTSAPEEKKIEIKKDAKKLTIGQKIKKEVQHYWDGTKLLATEVKISSRLALKMAGGYELSRREHRQVR